jgi:uncharacterized membrane protein required for colicin V production
MNEGVILPIASLLLGLPTGAWLDLGCAVITLTSISVGSRRGLTAEIPLGVGWFCGLLAAWYAYAPIHACLQQQPWMQGEPEFLLFFCLVAAVLLAWVAAVLVSRGLSLLAIQVEKTAADYALGTVAGVIRAFVILLIVTAILLGQPWWHRGRELFCEQSWTGRLFTPWASTLLLTLQKLNPHFEIHRRTDDPGDVIRDRPPSSKP